jgi:endonuclease G, mitochondrial
VVASAKDGSAVLHYQNFSIVMHARRRLALFTASNVTAETKLKKPEPGHDYTRKGLSGLGKNDQERWFLDPRLDNQYQLTDIFYTRDDGAFDKGHIVRREDVAWGKTYAALRRANGDTYHVTNCSPQVAGFNRSNLSGGDNWGGLENVVLKGAASERYCQFAGPVLDPHDQIFVGAAGGGVKLRVRIPSRFWKVVVVQTQEGVASYGFVLEQDLSEVPLELAVPDMFVKYMEPLTDLQKKGGITFPSIVLNADQYNTTEGEEMAFRAGARRRSSAEGTIS